MTIEERTLLELQYRMFSDLDELLSPNEPETKELHECNVITMDTSYRSKEEKSRKRHLVDGRTQ